MRINPYLFFDGRAEEALEFYRQALDAKVEFVLRFKESPSPVPSEYAPPGSENKIMHASLAVGETTLMLCDDMSPGSPRAMKGFSLSITAPDIATTDRLFAALSAGGQVTMPPAKTFWSPHFGMLTDRFGVGWMVGVAGEMG